MPMVARLVEWISGNPEVTPPGLVLRNGLGFRRISSWIASGRLLQCRLPVTNLSSRGAMAMRQLSLLLPECLYGLNA